MTTQKRGNTHIVRLVKGENIRDELNKYIKENNIPFGKLTAIGMLMNPILGFYNGSDYDWTTFEGGYEALSFNGNVSWVEGEPAIHIHASFGDHNFGVKGGHFKNAEVGMILEVFIDELEGAPVERELLDNLPLKTWKL